MTIKEAEERTGLARSNIRFYEKEGLIIPLKNQSNGYREYSEQDIDDIKKIAYLRTLGISIQNIRNIIEKKISLYEVLEKQSRELDEQVVDLNKMKVMCEKMLTTENLNYDNLEIEKYITELPDYWGDNQQLFKLDSVSFLYIWGSFVTWLVITILSFGIGIMTYAKLPPEIPVQWSDGVAVSQMKKEFIFIYPVACVIIRYLLRTCIYAKLQMNTWHRELIAEYLVNFMCFVALSVEIFSILFAYGVVKNVVVILVIDAVVFLGLLIMAISKIELKNE